ncbi:DUF4302 domain-containing protein [Pseudotamlana agarivorans]|uniref:DUF4302 domain-containing protein n=1 Tax=Pseudotamlana agarivorans TaxID=481183 RepID=UPI00082FE085|nr:DUF4302 domain-containing protein [Tamlana agarivorans]
MKYIYKLLKLTLSVCMLLLTVTACTDNDVEPLFDQSINERIDEVKTEYTDILTSSEYGWVGYYSPNKDFGAFTMLMDFDDSGYVSIASDYLKGAEDNTITYRIAKTLKLELVLETHAVFHAIYEINDNNNDGEYVFNILSVTEDEVVLESKTDYGDDITIFTLRKATQADLDLQPTFDSVDNLTGDGSESVFRNILLNDQAIASFEFDASSRVATITYIQNGQEITTTKPVVITAEGFYFIEPVEINGTILTSFTYDATNNEYVNTEDGLRIIYDQLPLYIGNDVQYLVQTGNPVFLYRPSLGSFPLTSPAHDTMYEAMNAQLNAAGFTLFEYSLTLDFNSDATCANQIRVVVQRNSDGANFFAFYCFDKPVVQDGRLYLDYVGTYGDGEALIYVLAPIVNMFNSAEGLLFTHEGNFGSYSNTAGTFTSLDNPALRVYGVFL